jgi:hypothetical protein
MVDDVRQGGDTANQDTSASADDQDADDGLDDATDNLMGRALEQQRDLPARQYRE